MSDIAKAKLAVEENKNKARKRIREADSSRITFIPADEEVDFYEDTSAKNVGLYARVSTDMGPRFNEFSVAFQRV